MTYDIESELQETIIRLMQQTDKEGDIALFFETFNEIIRQLEEAIQ